MMSYFSNCVAIFYPLPVQPRWKKQLQEVTEIKIMYWFIHVSQTYIHDIHWASDKMEAAGCATDVVHCLTADISEWLFHFCPQEEIGIETDEDYNVQPPDIWEGHAKKWNTVNELVVNKDRNTFCSLLTAGEMYKAM